MSAKAKLSIHLAFGNLKIHTAITALTTEDKMEKNPVSYTHLTLPTNREV